MLLLANPRQSAISHPLLFKAEKWAEAHAASPGGTPPPRVHQGRWVAVGPMTSADLPQGVV